MLGTRFTLTNDEITTLSLAVQRWISDSRPVANGEQLDGTCVALHMQDCARNSIPRMVALVEKLNRATFPNWEWPNKNERGHWRPALPAWIKDHVS